ncbi:MAG: hypothetical protein IJQ50_04685, partial [Clostridia bacterium]|nr:hypothetical protein [Clostridia bacterium]
MYGYVNIHKDLLRICDYNLFRGYYCGLCKQLGKKFNQITRIGLSYDMTFLAVFISSLNDGERTLKTENCIVHPFSKKQIIYDDEGIDYSSDISVIFTYLKLKDDWEDERRFRSLGRIFYYFSFKKVIQKYPDVYCCIRENLKKLSNLEKAGCTDVDVAADCFGKVLERVFDKNADNKAAAWLGYHIGRYIYIMDAFSDIEKDIKNKSYNPFVCRFGESLDREKLKTSVKESLIYT